MTTTPVSDDSPESTRMSAARIESDMLRRVAEKTQVVVASCMGVHPSTVSRMLEDLPKWSQLLAALELQVASSDSMMFDPDEIFAIENMASKYLNSKIESRRKGIVK
jgi:uncharacterized protein YmfQ (DUF2313 family)